MRQKKKTAQREEASSSKVKDYLVYYIFYFLITTGAVVCCNILQQRPQAEFIRNTVMTMIGCGTLIVAMSKSRLDREYEYDNEEHPARFLLIYVAGLAFAFICVLLPSSGWPFMAIAVALSIFSNWIIGLISVSLFLMITVFASEAPVEIFMMYFTICVVAVLLFHKMDEEFQIGTPFAVSLMMLLVVETACIVIFINENLTIEMFVVPLINLFVTSVILSIAIKFFALKVLHKYRDKYMEINDQEFSLMVELKELSKKEYYHAIHTAYFCDLIAKRMGADANVTKAGGYYHRICVLKGENPLDVITEVTEKFGFPPAVEAVLREYISHPKGIRSRETAILYFSDAIISAIMFLVEKDAQAKVDYDQIIETIFEKKLQSGIFSHCDLSLKDLNMMKNIFMEEKLYYDFLR